jgi:hypothetical protein
VSTIDLNNPPSNYHYSLSVNKEESAAERGVRLTKEMAVFLLAIVIAGCIYWLAFSHRHQSDRERRGKKWACPCCRRGPLAW